MASLSGKVTDNGSPLPLANVLLKGTEVGAATDIDGLFRLENIEAGDYVLLVTSLGYLPYQTKINFEASEEKSINIQLEPSAQSLDETVVTGTLKPVSRLESPVPVEVYSPTFLKKNPTASVFDALQNVNGVRPQINCNVCNTGDIHINGLEGPYTLVLIDGMPIVSGLGTVYGLTGIPNSLIEQIEIVKGPASSLYGSEAVGGLINIITKNALSAPEFFADGFATGWGEYNLDVGSKISIGNKTDLLLGVNYFNYDNPIDNNGDNFTDLTLQDRISIFQKWDFERNENRVLSLAGRFFYEDRWGGEMQWTPEYRGGDEVYGESIYTRRWEVLGKYQLPFEEKFLLSFSYNDHNQNSVYGDTEYLADQRIGFAQLTWDKAAGNHDLLFGSAVRYNFYDDNTPATIEADNIWIPSLFAQDEYTFAAKHSFLAGLRYDYDQRHGNILTPRAAYKWKISDNDIFRVNAGTGFRVVNLFTEDHAALTGSREVIIAEELKPERSVNVNINYLKKIYSTNGTFIGIDASAFYTRFSNVILPDYDTNPNQIIYDNLDGRSISQGVSANLDVAFPSSFKIMVGATWQDVSTTENGVTQQQILTESITATWNLSYTFRSLNLTADYTGNLYGPMRLPLLGELDPRQEYSPTWSIQNIQFTYKGLNNIEIYGGIKNLLDWTPNRGNPFIIARANDPFDKEVTFDSNGNAVATPNNPYALTFDPGYVYGPNQGIRGFFGLRYTVF
ncbi:TonB-dependent receptor [Flagellimonas zhangzhouensis]|uniref:Outer membrane receptor for ferrienterochelin and colicins n=1 Tax=Flagellimonas zhangzhouensis TaxID=1073328 RepID=A0A1H2UEE0_9FLAO|nr:TonB-dependent receptor [Allomuricauda zhangzhouensis]SDQ18188.1 outer membrane receptor for ferrienterochelin and colicins [Allomuricauda zhangzhouensis]SDW53899.1 outer membrane receptor for ferrienterochelin and colicins [Allomuricauda zhangzhouensis]